MLIFEKLSIQNFMSVGNHPLVFVLNAVQSTLIMAPNGSGKSILLDALCFVLFNKAYRKINKAQLINSINKKKTIVECVFSIGTKRFKIVRGIKPDKFEIYRDVDANGENGELVNQDSTRDYQEYLEQNILQFNYRAFTQVGVMGSAAYTPFMRLKPDVRREFIEELLDIKVFSTMKDLAFKQLKDAKDNVKTIGTEIVSNSNLIDMLKKHIAEMASNTKENSDRLNEQIATLMEENRVISENVTEINEKVSILNEKIDAEKKKLSKKTELTDIRTQLVKNIKSLKVEIDRMSALDVCPTCTQKVTEETKTTYIDGMKSSGETYIETLNKLDKKLVKYSNVSDVLAELNGELTTLNRKLLDQNSKINVNNALISSLNSELNRATNSTDTQSKNAELDKLNKKHTLLLDKKNELLDQQSLCNAAYSMLQDDGIKSKVIKKYVPVINKLINLNLEKLDLFCQFTLDECFNETVKARHRDIFTYDSFSQGEKQRIDIALLFTWRELSSMKNSLNMNLVVMDEILDTAMDSEGMKLCIDLIKSIKNTNVIVISHREAISDEFDQVIHLKKKNNFTQIA